MTKENLFEESESVRKIDFGPLFAKRLEQWPEMAAHHQQQLAQEFEFLGVERITKLIPTLVVTTSFTLPRVGLQKNEKQLWMSKSTNCMNYRSPHGIIDGELSEELGGSYPLGFNGINTYWLEDNSQSKNFLIVSPVLVDIVEDVREKNTFKTWQTLKKKYGIERIGARAIENINYFEGELEFGEDGIPLLEETFFDKARLYQTVLRYEKMYDMDPLQFNNFYEGLKFSFSKGLAVNFNEAAQVVTGKSNQLKN